MRQATIVIWRVALTGLLAANVATAQRIDFTGDNAVGWEYLIPDISVIPSVPLLDHFDLGYERDDHHVLAAMVFPPRDGLTPVCRELTPRLPDRWCADSAIRQ